MPVVKFSRELQKVDASLPLIYETSKYHCHVGMLCAVVPTQQPAYGDSSVQTEWGQDITQPLQLDLERREVIVKPWVTLLHVALLAHT